jgi:hypothetical protein
MLFLIQNDASAILVELDTIPEIKLYSWFGSSPIFQIFEVGSTFSNICQRHQSNVQFYNMLFF